MEKASITARMTRQKGVLLYLHTLGRRNINR